MSDLSLHDEAALATLAMAIWCGLRTPWKKFLQKNKNLPSPPTHLKPDFQILIPQEITGGEVLSLAHFLFSFRWKGIQERVQKFLQRWALKEIPCGPFLCDFIHTPKQMLDLQAQGLRPVALVPHLQDHKGQVIEGKDAFEFFLHDLEHAERFYEAPEITIEQTQFFSKLRGRLKDKEFSSFSKIDSTLWPKSFQYLASDMNGHGHYLEAYLQHYLNKGIWD